MPRAASTTEFRDAVKRAMFQHNLRYESGYTDKPPQSGYGSHRTLVRYVSVPVSCDDRDGHIELAVNAINAEMKQLGVDTVAKHIGYYIRGVCEAA